MKDITVVIKGKKVSLTAMEANNLHRQLDDIAWQNDVENYVDDMSCEYVMDEKKTKKAVKFIKDNQIWGEVDELMSFWWGEFVRRNRLKEKEYDYA